MIRSPKTPVRTDPLPEEKRGAWFEGADTITALHVYNGVQGVVEFDLPRDVQRFTMGASSQCDIVLPGHGLSKVHCVLERQGDRLRLVDQNSTHGVVFQDHKVKDVVITPGDMFTLPPVTFLAMNDEMRAQRSTLVEVYGTGLEPSLDGLLVAAARGSSNLLLRGEPDCGQDRLAAAIHAVSLRRNKKLIQLTAVPEERAKQRAVIDSAARSTLVIPIVAGQLPLDATFVSMACSPSYFVRVIVITPTVDEARRVLGKDAVDQMMPIWVRPLALRSDVIDRLLDRAFAERGCSYRASDLTHANLAALRGYDWPHNLVSLYEMVDTIIEYEKHAGLRPAAKALGKSKTALEKYFSRKGMNIPVLERDRG